MNDREVKPELLEFEQNGEIVTLYASMVKTLLDNKWAPEQVGMAPMFTTDEDMQKFALTYTEAQVAQIGDSLWFAFNALSEEQCQELSEQSKSVILGMPLFEDFESAEKLLMEIRNGY